MATLVAPPAAFRNSRLLAPPQYSDIDAVRVKAGDTRGSQLYRDGLGGVRYHQEVT